LLFYISEIFGLEKEGYMGKMFEHMKTQLNECHMIDSTIIRANQCSAGYAKNSQEEQCLGGSRGGYGTKVHTLTDKKSPARSKAFTI
jgi:hypothetical protein